MPAFDPEKFVEIQMAKGWPDKAAVGLAMLLDFASEEMKLVRDTSLPLAESADAETLLANVMLEVASRSRKIIGGLTAECAEAKAEKIREAYELAVGAVRATDDFLVSEN